MKKIFLTVAIIATIFLTGCGSLSDKDIREKFINEVESLKTYVVEGTLTITNNDEQIALSIKEISDKVDILKVDSTKEHIATSLDMLNDKADAAHDYDAKLIEAMEGLSVKMDTFSIVDDQLLRKSSEVSDKADEIHAVADQMTGVLNNIAENVSKIDENGLELSNCSF